MTRSLRPHCLVLLAVAAAGLAATAGSARAATVVAENEPEATVARSSLVIEDAGAGPNAITVSSSAIDETTAVYSIVDEAEPPVAGEGCVTAGPSEVRCELLRARAPDCHYNSLGAFCFGGAVVRLSITLGEGDDRLDLTGIAPLPPGDATSGAGQTLGADVDLNGGDDEFLGGDQPESVVLGLGADVAQTGLGSDVVRPSDGPPDGPDLIDLGPAFDPTVPAALAEHDVVNYAVATGPIRVSVDGVADDGVEGEGDNVISAETIYGGNFDDLLIGGDAPEKLSASGGSDTVFGGGGDDELEGDSVLVGELIPPHEPGSNIIHGGPGDDALDGGELRDRAFGEHGDDTIQTAERSDLASGGPGADRISDYDGRDRLRGGEGRDRLRTVIDRGFVRARPARLDCGPQRDRAVASVDDELRRCERVVVVGG